LGAKHNEAFVYKKPVLEVFGENELLENKGKGGERD
jgi:hypothetical protein